jgi:hypothetical protein
MMQNVRVVNQANEQVGSVNNRCRTYFVPSEKLHDVSDSIRHLDRIDRPLVTDDVSHAQLRDFLAEKRHRDDGVVGSHCRHCVFHRATTGKQMQRSANRKTKIAERGEQPHH